MFSRVKSKDLRRRMGDVLNRVKYTGESVLVERYNDHLAAIVPAGVITDPDFFEEWVEIRRGEFEIEANRVAGEAITMEVAAERLGLTMEEIRAEAGKANNEASSATSRADGS